MWQEIATWQETLKERSDLSAKTVALYTQDARRFATGTNRPLQSGRCPMTNPDPPMYH